MIHNRKVKECIKQEKMWMPPTNREQNNKLKANKKKFG